MHLSQATIIQLNEMRDKLEAMHPTFHPEVCVDFFVSKVGAQGGSVGKDKVVGFVSIEIAQQTSCHSMEISRHGDGNFQRLVTDGDGQLNA